MPELGEVEVVRRNLVRWWEGRRASKVRLRDESLLKNSDAGRLETALTRRLETAERRGKYLMCHLAGDRTAVFHFRMTGKIIRCDDPEREYARLSWYVDETGWLSFVDQRRLGTAHLMTADELASYEPLVEMGPEPEDLTVTRLRGSCTGRRLLKTALLDQAIVAGVGNIAISELFWRLEIRPDVRCGELSDRQLGRLIEEMPRYFEEVVEFSMADEIEYLQEGGADNPFAIYGRDGAPCPRCQTALAKTRVGGRSSFYCPVCQGEDDLASQ